MHLLRLKLLIQSIMPRRKGRRSKADTKKSSASWTTTKNDHSKQGKVFDPLAASVRKNKEYLELKRDIALKGTNLNWLLF